MPGENLTRVEAIERKKIVDVQSYEIDLDLTTGDEIFSSTTVVKFTATPGASTFIDFINSAVHTIELNGEPLDPAEFADRARITLPNLQAENVLLVCADALYTNTGEGLHRFVDPADGETYLYTQFEVPDSRRVFAVFEQPDLKATFQFTVTAPDYWQVVSNQATPEPESLADGKARWTFAPTPRISSYITALIAGPYDVTRSTLKSADGREVALGVFSRKSLTEFMDADYIFDITRAGFDFYENQFGVTYPFEKYDQLFVPEFNAGAMENAGAVTFTETYVFRSKVTDAVKERRVVTILHELAHMWFGDLVTMKWWDDLWLNESFAEYISHLATANATEWVNTWTTFVAQEKSWAYRQDQLPSTHPVYANIRDLEDVEVNFDGITYAKGGSVLKQLVAWVGQEQFMKGLNQYFKKHAWSNTEFKDLLTELESTSGRELGDWAEKWLKTSGVNTLVADFDYEDKKITRFEILQSAAADYPTIRPHRIGVAGYCLEDDGVVRRHWYEELDVDGEVTVAEALVGKTLPDLVLLNDEDLTYAKIRLDDRSKAFALEHLGDFENSLARALIWGAFWEGVRDAQMPARDFIDLVIRHIAKETESTTLRNVLNFVVTAAKIYSDPAKRAERLVLLADTMLELAKQAEPESDAQFQFVKFFAALAETAEQLDAVEELRSGKFTLTGLSIDTDLSWELLEALVLGGRAGTAEIDAALAADNTATGQQAAARARATVPTAEAKLEAFEFAAGEPAPSNLIVRATGLGFQHANSPENLQVIVEPYFAKLQDIYAKRSFAIANGIITGFYPATLANQELVAKTEEWLKANPEPAALNRLITENLAGVTRALAAQELDKS